MSEQPDREFDPETVHAILADSRRRTVVETLEAGERLSVAELADELASRESDPGSDGIDPSARREITVSLVHDHLPRLDDHGVIDYERQTHEITAIGSIDVEGARPDGRERLVDAD